jgi:hypothetical protein
MSEIALQVATKIAMAFRTRAKEFLEFKITYRDRACLFGAARIQNGDVLNKLSQSKSEVISGVLPCLSMRFSIVTYVYYSNYK